MCLPNALSPTSPPRCALRCRMLHPHDASEHQLAKAKQGISSLSKPRHLSVRRSVCCQTALAPKAFSDPLAFQQSARVPTLRFRTMSPCSLHEVAPASTCMMHELGSSILWQRPKPSRTHDIAMSPKRGMCTPHTICRALEPSFDASRRLRCFSRLQRALPLPCGSPSLAIQCQRRRWSVARPPCSLEMAASAVGSLPASAHEVQRGTTAL
jgi:hypothetical protein